MLVSRKCVSFLKNRRINYPKCLSNVTSRLSPYRPILLYIHFLSMASNGMANVLCETIFLSRHPAGGGILFRVTQYLRTWAVSCGDSRRELRESKGKGG